MEIPISLLADLVYGYKCFRARQDQKKGNVY